MTNNTTSDTESSPAVRNAMRFFHQEVRIKELETLLAQAAVALQLADEAINPPDRSGISMDTWNKRLKACTTTIREALAALRALTPENKTEGDNRVLEDLDRATRNRGARVAT